MSQPSPTTATSPELDAEAAQAVDLIERLAVDLVIDVGANEGQWALALRRAGYRGRLVSFEPVGASFEALQRAATGDTAWRTLRMALGREDGSLRIGVTRNSVFASAHEPSAYARRRFPHGVEEVGEEQVPLRRLDALLPELAPDLTAPRILLKLDTQGHDLDVFAGAREILDRVVVLQSELSVVPLYEKTPSWIEALGAYAEAGFVPCHFHPVVRTLPHGALCEFDCLMVRNPKLSLPAPGVPSAVSVSVVVTACADGPALRRCLAVLREQTRALGGETLLVFNVAESALAATPRRELEALCDRILFEPRTGKSYALNTAVAVARGDVIAFTDDDAEPQPGWLERLTAPLRNADRDPRLVGCGGSVEPIWTAETPDWYREVVLAKRTHFLGPHHDLGPEPRDYDETKEDEVAAPLGANCAYLRSVFGVHHYDPQLGPNRETGLRGGEDYLVGRLLLQEGYRLCYVPDARVRHPVDPSRATESYATRGYYLQGIEWIRIHRVLDADAAVDLRAVRRHLWRLRRRSLLLWLRRASPEKQRRLRFKRAFQRGMLDELQRGAREVRRTGG